MPRQLFDHAQPEDRLFGGVMQHVQADQAGVKIPVRGVNIIFVFRFRHSITNSGSISHGYGSDSEDTP